MKTVVVVGWNVGFQKMKFTKLLRRDFGYSLSDAKAATDAVLDSQRLELNVQDTACDQMLSTLRELGTIIALEDQLPNS